jgi:hypothetical protein
MKHVTASLTIASCLLLAAAGTAFASPTGTPSSTPDTGHKAGPTNTCPSPPIGTTPGNAVSANGSPFNPDGKAGTVYAGNPGTASLANSNSTASVSQYDNACFRGSLR